MAIVYVLNIEHPTLKPCLELIRRVCDPESKSKPHITVRYLERLKKSDLSIYSGSIVPYIDLVSPGSFGIEEDFNQGNKTVFIKCISDELERLAYKPHYPDSLFHITLYNGSSSAFASKLLGVLNKYNWRFRVNLVNKNSLTKISLREESNTKNLSRDVFSDYSTDVQELFYSLTNTKITRDLVSALTEYERLKIVDDVCSYLIGVFSVEGQKFIEDQVELPLDNPLSDKAFITKDFLSPDITETWKKKNIQGENKVGLYLTPPELASEIVDYALDQFENKEIPISFGDPAIGTGVFFSSLQYKVDGERLVSSIGIELDSRRAYATEQKWKHKGLTVVKGDYLHIKDLPLRNLIIANPPYVRYQHIVSEYGKKLRERASVDSGIKISGQSGLYVYFLLASHAWMERNAVAAWLLPTEFMVTNYGKSIREYLTNKVSVIRIHQFDRESPQFENALVSSCVVVFRNNKPNPAHSVVFSSGGSIMDADEEKVVSVEDLKQKVKWSYSTVDSNFSYTAKFTIGDFFDVKRGIATGANDYFIMTRFVASEKGIPESLLKPILPKSKTLASAIVDAQPDGYPNVVNQLCVFDSDHDEEYLRKNFPEVGAYLDEADSLDIKSRNLIRNRRNWCQQEKRAPAPFLCTYMGRGSKEHSPVRFIMNRSKAIATNSYILMYPNSKVQKIIEASPEKNEELFDFLVRVEKSSLIDFLRDYGGGLRKIEPRDLSNVPAMNPPKWLEETVEEKMNFDIA